MDTGDGISKGPGLWSFSDGVAPVFGEHARKSIPGYDDGHDLICKISDHFIGPSSRCVDIGCSAGELLARLWQRHAAKQPDLLGIDIEQEMIDFASKAINNPNIRFER